jgi:hypothetical protein
MNKRSIKKKRPAKASRNGPARKPAARAAAAHKAATRKSTVRESTVRKSSARKSTVRKSSARKSAVRQPPRNPEALSAVRGATAKMATVTVAQVTALSPVLRTHKFRVGQTVFYTSSPISRPGATGSYQVVRLLPSDGDDYQYRIKNPGEAFERVAKESQLDNEH